MKHIRHLAAALLFITGLLHFIPLFIRFDDPDTFPMLLFGLGYLIIAYLLFKNKAVGVFFGVILPLIGVGAAFIKIGFENWDLLLQLMIAIDIVVVVCCVLLLNRKRYGQ